MWLLFGICRCIFVIENNGYGLSTPSSEQFKCESFVDKCIGYGIEGVSIDGNNILEVYQTIKKLAQSIRENPRPILVECMTFRMRGHEEASGTKYVPKNLFEVWEKKDPVINYEQFLLQNNLLTQAKIESIKTQINEEISEAVHEAFDLPAITPNTSEEIADLYVKHELHISPVSQQTKELRLVDAISEGLKMALKKHPNLLLMGQDVADYGGVFKVSEGFVEEFGKERIRNTPLCESAIIGAALGLSIKGYKSVVEMQFADFVSCGFNQIVNNLAKINYRWGQNADVVVRMPTGAGVGAGPFHSQSDEAWFTHVPGLKVVYPSNPMDAKGLLIASIEDPNPVMFFEHKALYRSIKGDVYEDYYTIEIGKANIVQQGADLTIITYGFGVHWAKEALKEMPHIKAELIDLRTLLPLDTACIYESVKKTGKAIILHEDTLTGGLGGEISALINENCFEYLDAPVVRSASLDTPVPFCDELEWNFLPKERFKTQLKTLYEY
jgi:2-oxoisovalerate dehydrogenase E1 component